MANKSLAQFYEDFNEEIQVSYETDSSGWNKEDFFTSIMLEYLEDAGEVNDSIMCPFRGYGLQLNAYSIAEDFSTLDIFVSIYLESDKPKTVSQTDVDAAVKRAIQLYHKAINDLYTSFQKDNDTYEFAITLHDHKNDIKTVRICALTNGTVKPINFKNITISEAEVSFSIWDIDRLYRCVMSGKMRETIEIDFQEKYNLTIPCIENSSSDKYSVYLATNMISVGLDVPRLGLMTVAGQPKTTSEYIQATSRVGRDTGAAPGIVFVLYRPGRPRDKSHYEHFKEYHSRLYCNVEPTSVTPFSAPVRERALHAIMVGMIRLESDNVYNESSPHIPSDNMLAHIKSVIEERIQEIDPEEMDDTMDRWQDILDYWEAWNPTCWEPKRNRDFSYTKDVPLMYSAGSHRNEAWGTRGIETPTSMRSVDASCEAEVLSRKYVSKGEE